MTSREVTSWRQWERDDQQFLSSSCGYNIVFLHAVDLWLDAVFAVISSCCLSADSHVHPVKDWWRTHPWFPRGTFSYSTRRTDNRSSTLLCIKAPGTNRRFFWGFTFQRFHLDLHKGQYLFTRFVMWPFWVLRILRRTQKIQQISYNVVRCRHFSNCWSSEEGACGGSEGNLWVQQVLTGTGFPIMNQLLTISDYDHEDTWLTHTHTKGRPVCSAGSREFMTGRVCVCVGLLLQHWSRKWRSGLLSLEKIYGAVMTSVRVSFLTSYVFFPSFFFTSSPHFLSKLSYFIKQRGCWMMVTLIVVPSGNSNMFHHIDTSGEIGSLVSCAGSQ